jgi:AcrR family transcriptional regulator
MYCIEFSGVIPPMRVRTEEKRNEIIRIAGELFDSQGFERTSMSQISERLGGSKATLYGYFPSKQELLYAVLNYDVSTEADRLMGEFLAAEDLREGLINLGVAYMMRRLSTTPISNVRIVSTQPEGSQVGPEFYKNVLRPAWQRLAKRFEQMMGEGRLQKADPWVVAMHWKGLQEWDMFEKRLMGAITEPDAKEIRRASTLGAEAFLKLYGTAKSRPPKKGKVTARTAKR